LGSADDTATLQNGQGKQNESEKGFLRSAPLNMILTPSKGQKSATSSSQSTAKCVYFPGHLCKITDFITHKERDGEVGLVQNSEEMISDYA
jgi:hypothetical protein